MRTVILEPAGSSKSPLAVALIGLELLYDTLRFLAQVAIQLVCRHTALGVASTGTGTWNAVNAVQSVMHG